MGNEKDGARDRRSDKGSKRKDVANATKSDAKSKKILVIAPAKDLQTEEGRKQFVRALMGRK